MYRRIPWASWRCTEVLSDGYAVAGPLHPVIQSGAEDQGSLGVLQDAIVADKPSIVFRLEDPRGSAYLNQWQVIMYLSQTNIYGNQSPETSTDITSLMLLGRGSVTIDISDFGACIVTFRAYNRSPVTATSCNMRVELFGCFAEMPNKLPADTVLPFAIGDSVPDYAETPGQWTDDEIS